MLRIKTISRKIRDIALILFFFVFFAALLELCIDLFLGNKKLVKHELYSDLLGDFAPNLNSVQTVNEKFQYKIRTNSDGMRGPDIDIENKERRVRVLCIGDSFTEGVGVDDPYTYPAILSKLLNASVSPKRVDVINAGFFMYDIVDEFDYYRMKGFKLKPDVVVVQFYCNDLDLFPYGNFFRPAHDKGREYSGVLQMLYNTSSFYYASLLAHEARKVNGFNGILEEGGARAGMYSKYAATGFVDDINLISEKPRLLDEKNSERTRVVWAKYKEVLLDFYNEVKKNNTQFVFVIIPDRIQVKEYYNAPSFNLVPFLKQNDIPFIDLTRSFRKAYSQQNVELFNYPHDMHCNITGNTLVAKNVADKINIRESGDIVLGRQDEACYFGYGNQTKLLIDFTDKGFALRDEAEAVVENVSYDNIELVRADFLGKTIDFYQSQTPDGKNGRVVMKIQSKQCIKHFSEVSFRKLYSESGGAILHEYSLDGDTYSQVYQYDKSNGDLDGFENQFLFEWDAAVCVKEIYFKFELNGRGAIMTEEGESRFRRFEVNLYH